MAGWGCPCPIWAMRIAVICLSSCTVMPEGRVPFFEAWLPPPPPPPRPLLLRVWVAIGCLLLVWCGCVALSWWWWLRFVRSLRGALTVTGWNEKLAVEIPSLVLLGGAAVNQGAAVVHWGLVVVCCGVCGCTE